MIWVGVFLLATLALAPMALALRGGAPARARREAALALHRAQLTEIDRDLAEGRLDATEHEAAKLEIQRRLLAADAATEPDERRRARGPLLLILPLVGMAGVLLYLAGGTPQMPAQPLAERIVEARRQAGREDELVDELRRRIGELPKDSPRRREGLMILGNAEASRGHMAEAAAAWREVLADGFDPTLAAMTGAAIFQAEGKVTDEALALFRRALAEAPPDAPWRPMAERMIQRAGQ